MDQDLSVGTEAGSSWMDQDLSVGTEAGSSDGILGNHSLYRPLEEAKTNSSIDDENSFFDVPAEFSKMDQSRAEQRFMGSQQTDIHNENVTYARDAQDRAFDPSRVLETLRRVALLASDPKTVRHEWFPVIEVENPDETTTAEQLSSISAIADGLTGINTDDVPHDSDYPAMNLTALGIDTITSPDSMNDVSDPAETILDSSTTQTYETMSEAHDSSASDTQIYTLDDTLERALPSDVQSREVIHDPDSDAPLSGFFADLQTKNAVFGNTMELDARKLSKSIEASQEWHRGDDDVFASKGSNRELHSKPKTRAKRTKKHDQTDQLEPITQEIAIHQSKKGRLISALVKKR